MKPQIMIIGSHHYRENFSSSEPNEVFLNSLETLRKYLINFQPSRVCIELEKDIQDTVDEYYSHYDPSKFYKNESYDLGFYIGKHLNLKSILAIDRMGDNDDSTDLSSAYEWAKENDEHFIQRIKDSQSFHSNLRELNDAYQMTLELNKPVNYKRDEELYGHMMLLGEDWKNSIPWLSWWYKRNMIMVNNITEDLDDTDKVIVIVGSDHVYILKQMLESSNTFNVMTFYEWMEFNNEA